MKDYLIWLKSGENICGTAKEDTAEWLLDKFKNREYELEKIISFDDEDGTISLDMDRIEAVSIMACCENKQVGFKS
ncbi:hypothetical protein ACJDU8_17215 [Clostridium sp. WILCCON 0269]|uniref:Uncharacterized protein n=1 Tax=Candidatus Clostridium eludens TaxID=3381663 RepID=A0ABW8SMJ8_9CLOT